MSTDTVSASRRVQKKGQEGRGDAVLLGGVSQGRGRGGGDGWQASLLLSEGRRGASDR